MNENNLLYLIIVLFAVTAFFGLTILSSMLNKKDASRKVVYGHGLFAATSLVLLVVYAVQNPDNYPQASIILFVLAALGGFYMFFNDINKKQVPKAIPFIHALIAVSGFIALLLFVFG